jgi:predicted nucleotidyltransferase component of viral defense system
MVLDIIEERLKKYATKSKQEEENALKEICQEIALAGLSRANFFKTAAFQGGTCLRIVYGLKRFSEDLDFILIEPNSFQWKPYLLSLTTEFNSFGLNFEALDRSKAENMVKKAFLKEDSFGKLISLKHSRLPSDKQILIKLEIDTFPPLGSSFETHFLEYPYPFSLLVQDKPSLFASKCHALLCRPYIKGRDWFDFLWYIRNKVSINYLLLQNALKQIGPYKQQEIFLDKKWIIKNLENKIISIDWPKACQDVENFISLEDRKFVQNWTQEFFLSQLLKLNEYL